jgi:hypothetical protein
MVSALLARVVALIPALAAALTITGFGIGLAVAAFTSALLASVDESRSGIASGTLAAFRQTGSVLGVALFGSLLAGRGALGGLEVDAEDLVQETLLRVARWPGAAANATGGRGETPGPDRGSRRGRCGGLVVDRFGPLPVRAALAAGPAAAVFDQPPSRRAAGRPAGRAGP